THRRHVREIHRERLVAEVLGIDLGEEVRSRNHGVGRDGEIHAVGHVEERAIVAYPEDRVRGGAREMPRDEIEFAVRFRHGLAPFLRGAATSSARTFFASRSSTPFTYLCPSVPPKRFPSSIASLIVARYGISGRCISSQAPMRRIALSIGLTSSHFRSASGSSCSRSALASPMVPRSSLSRKHWSAL